MITVSEKLNRDIDELIRKISRLEGRLKVRRGRESLLFRKHLMDLGREGVTFLTDVIKRDIGRPTELAEGWHYRIAGGRISWYKTDGDKTTAEGLTLNLLVHFMDRGTATHGPVTAKVLHYYGKGAWAGMEFFVKEVRGIAPRYYFRQLEDYIIKLHHERLPALKRAAFEGVS